MNIEQTKLDVTGKAAKMIEELKFNWNFIPRYDAETINQCIDEISHLHALNTEFFRHHETDSVSQEAMTLATTRVQIIERLRRCCCAYLNERLNRLKEFRWRFAGNISPEIRANLSADELTWLENYNKILFDYQQSFEESEVNLLNAIHPPKSTLMQVKSLRDYGEFETSDGLAVVFRKNTLHLIPRKDSEALVKKGILEYV